MENAATGFFNGLKDFLSPVANAARDDYIRENFPERIPGVDSTSDTIAGVTPAELEQQAAESERQMLLIGGAAVLTAVLITLIAKRG